MPITSTFISSSTGLTWNGAYHEIDSFDPIRALPIEASGAICFYGDKLVLVYAVKRNAWEMPGGGREAGETIEQGMIREIHEETNMKVLELIPLGYDIQTSQASDQVWYHGRFAARVEPYGPFVADPDGGITKIILIDPKDYKSYFDWGERSDAMIAKARKVLGV